MEAFSSMSSVNTCSSKHVVRYTRSVKLTATIVLLHSSDPPPPIVSLYLMTFTRRLVYRYNATLVIAMFAALWPGNRPIAAALSVVRYKQMVMNQTSGLWRDGGWWVMWDTVGVNQPLNLASKDSQSLRGPTLP